jgi:hypothetical protein
MVRITRCLDSMERSYSLVGCSEYLIFTETRTICSKLAHQVHQAAPRAAAAACVFTARRGERGHDVAARVLTELLTVGLDVNRRRYRVRWFR